MARLVSWSILWVTLGALWLMLVFRDVLVDVLCAVVVAAAVTVCAAAAHRHEHTLFSLPRGWLRPALRLPGELVRDSWLLVVALYRRLLLGEATRGREIVIPIDPGGADPASAARRALVVTGLCIAPNTVVVSHAEGSISVHQLVDTGERPEDRDREWPL